MPDYIIVAVTVAAVLLIIEMFEDVIKENNTLYWALKIDSNINPEIKEYIEVARVYSLISFLL